MKPYTHIVQYYETDKMGVTHHSNYIRWMEEARVVYMEQIGWSYDKLEKMGVMSPVLAVNCRYQNSTTFMDSVCIHVRVKSFTGVRLVIEYEMKKKDDTPVLTGTSEHCFLTMDFKPIRLKKCFPEFYQILLDLAADGKDEKRRKKEEKKE